MSANRNPVEKESEKNAATWAHLSPAGIGINMVRWDEQCYGVRPRGTLPNISRFYDQNVNIKGLPAPVGTHGDEGNARLSQWWQDYFDSINSLKARIYTYGKNKRKLNSGWVNTVRWPVVRQVTWCGAYVVCDERDGDMLRIKCLDNAKRPADYAGQDFRQSMSVLYNDGSKGYPDADPVYTFLIANPGKSLWMNAYDLTFVRPVAIPVSIDAVMAQAA